MRVISGHARGLKLASPPGTDTRPTLDRVKEAVFSMLLPYLYDASVLDLFAGSGALGIEAVSRGAKEAVFTDNSASAVSCVKSNITNAKITDCTSVIQIDSLKYLNQCTRQFDIIFVDPPYQMGIYDSVLKLIKDNDILSQYGLIIIEWDFETGFTDNMHGFELFKEKKYGRVGVSVLRRRIEE